MEKKIRIIVGSLGMAVMVASIALPIITPNKSGWTALAINGECQ